LEDKGGGPLLDSTIATRIVLAFQSRPTALQARLPAPWQVTATPAGANLVVIFNDVWLNQDASGRAAPDAVNRYVGFVTPAKHPDTGEEASFNFRIFTAHPDSLPGKYRTARPATIRREQEVQSDALTATVSERFTFQIPDGGLVDLRLKYVGGVPTHAAGRARVRSAADPAILRVYHVDQLVYVVRDVPKGIDRVQDLRVDVTVPELRDLFDGSEQLISITVSPHYFRQVYGR